MRRWARTRVALLASPARFTLIAVALSALCGAWLRWDFATRIYLPGDHLFGDMEVYLAQARALVDRPREPWDTFTPPGYPAFLALLGVRAVDDLGRLVAAHAALGGLTSGLGALLAAKLTRSRVATAAAGLAIAAYLPLVFYAGLVLTETLFAALLVSFVVVLDRATSRHAAWGVFAGVLLAAAILVRPSLLAFAPIGAALAYRGRPERALPLRRALLVALVALAPVALANSWLLGRPSLVATNGGVNFYLDMASCKSVRSTAPGPIVEISTHYTRNHFEEGCTNDAPFIQERAYYEAGLREIAEHPSRLVRALDGVREGLGLTEVRPWPNQPFWPGSMAMEDALWRHSRAYAWIVLAPALAFAWSETRRARREGDEPARLRVAVCVGVLASVAVVLYLFNGNPRVRVSSDPIAIALAAGGFRALGGFLVQRARRVLSAVS